MLLERNQVDCFSRNEFFFYNQVEPNQIQQDPGKCGYSLINQLLIKER